MQDLAKIWEILKIEKGEPTKYVQQDTKATIQQREVLNSDDIKKIEELLSHTQ